VPECSAGPVSGPPDLQGDKLNVNSDLTGHFETFLVRMYVMRGTISKRAKTADGSSSADGIPSHGDE
jgi:hypothetical protein